jgi:hypothetical protein
MYSLGKAVATELTSAGGGPTWLQDSRRLLYDSGPEIHLLDTTTRRDRILYRTVPNDLDIAGQPGGVQDWLYFAKVSREADIWGFDLQ